MKATRLSAALCACALLIGATACDSGTDDEGAHFRHGKKSTPFWEWNLSAEANGDVEVYAGEGVNPLDLIWDVDGGTTSQVVPGSDGEQTLVAIQDVGDNTIYDGQGNVLCTAVQSNGGPKAYQLLDGDGDVIFTLWHQFVFEGDVAFSGPNSANLGQLIQQGALYSFHRDEIYFDTWWEGDVAATVSTKVNRANPMRKLVLASLVAGECGSAGLP